MKDINNYSGGYIALSSILVIAAVVLAVGLSLSLTSINELQSSYSSKKSDQALALVESCAEEALLQINTRSSLPPSISLPEGNCSVTIDSHLDDDWIFTVNAVVDGYAKSIRVTLNSSGTLKVSSWMEI